MAFEKNREYEDQLEFKNGGSVSHEFPSGNFFAAMTMDINLDINLATNAATAALAHQIARVIEKFELVRDGKHIEWQISGESLARLFRKIDGLEAAGNVSMTTAIGNNKTGRMTLRIPFYPMDAVKPSDYALDTVHHKWELKIKYRDVKADGVLFRVANTSDITVNDAGSYIDLQLDKITPLDGDSYLKTTPHFYGLIEAHNEVNQTKPNAKFELPENEVIRSVVLFANHEATADEWTGANDIMSDVIALKNTQGRTYQKPKVSMLREETSLKWREGSNLEAGLYEFDFTQYGNMVDAIVSDGVTPLYLQTSVTKKAGATRVTQITQTIISQGGL